MQTMIHDKTADRCLELFAAGFGAEHMEARNRITRAFIDRTALLRICNTMDAELGDDDAPRGLTKETVDRLREILSQVRA